MNPNGKVQMYFQRHAQQFDQLYQQNPHPFNRLNQWLRQPFYRRFELTLAACGDVQGKRILDVGCGSGRYSVTLAEQGAEVVGIDFAGNMLALAQRLAREHRVSARCRFIEADFLEYNFTETFDISLAIGFFDYISNPRPFFEKLCLLTREKVIVTYAPPGGWRTLQRWIRYRLQGCPVYFHSQQAMVTHFAAAGYQNWQFVGSWAVALPIAIYIPIYKKGGAR